MSVFHLTGNKAVDPAHPDDLLAAMDQLFRASVDKPVPMFILCDDMRGPRTSCRWRGRRFAYRKPSVYELIQRYANKEVIA